MITAELRGGNRPSLNEALGWIGSKVDDLYGSSVGRLEDVWIDPGTGAPKWLLVKEGRFGGRTTLIPFEDATAGAGHVWIPYERDVVRGAPAVSPGAPLTQSVEGALRSHYAANKPAAPSQRTREAGVHPPAPPPAPSQAQGYDAPAPTHQYQLQGTAPVAHHRDPHQPLPPLPPSPPPVTPAARAQPAQPQAPAHAQYGSRAAQARPSHPTPQGPRGARRAAHAGYGDPVGGPPRTAPRRPPTQQALRPQYPQDAQQQPVYRTTAPAAPAPQMPRAPQAAQAAGAAQPAHFPAPAPAPTPPATVRPPEASLSPVPAAYGDDDPDRPVAIPVIHALDQPYRIEVHLEGDLRISGELKGFSIKPSTPGNPTSDAPPSEPESGQ